MTTAAEREAGFLASLDARVESILEACSRCGRCVEVCPTGALWPRHARQGTLKKDPERIVELIEKRQLEK